MKKYIDLHSHTYYSDGLGTPTSNVLLARANEIDVLAITDHDKIDGYEEAKRVGDLWQVKIIPGVEISTDKYHILGLGIDPYNTQLKNLLEYSNAEQKKVCEGRIALLRERGVPISLEKVLQVSPQSRLGKMNVLFAMMQDPECQRYFLEKEGSKVDKKIYEAYMKKEGSYLSDKMTAVTPQAAIEAIHAARGIAIIAHPFLEVKDMAELDLLKEQGLDGIEYQPRGGEANLKFVEFAGKNNLLVTYGSDYHGGAFGRPMLTNKGENILYPRLAKALGLEELI